LKVLIYFGAIDRPLLPGLPGIALTVTARRGKRVELHPTRPVRVPLVGIIAAWPYCDVLAEIGSYKLYGYVAR
jgi:hypothetical protein